MYGVVECVGGMIELVEVFGLLGVGVDEGDLGFVVVGFGVVGKCEGVYDVGECFIIVVGI